MNHVTFDEAQHLKELGFDRAIHYHYSLTSKKLARSTVPTKHNESRLFLSTPTYSEALDYFREEKGFECGVFPIMQSLRDGLKMIVYDYRIYDLNRNCKRIRLSVSLLNISTHSEAEKALFRAVVEYLIERK